MLEILELNQNTQGLKMNAMDWTTCAHLRQILPSTKLRTDKQTQQEISVYHISNSCHVKLFDCTLIKLVAIVPWGVIRIPLDSFGA